MSMTPSSRKLKRSSHTDVGLEITSTVMRTLEKIAAVSPVPGLSEAAGMALRITELVQRVRGNRDAFQRLAANACELVYVVCHAYKDVSEAKDVNPELEGNLDNVLNVLLSIQDLANEGVSRGRFKALWRTDVDADKIKECRERLQQCLRRFGLESDINVRLMVHKLVSQNEKIMGILESNDGPIPPNVVEVHRDGVLKEEKQRQLNDAAEVGKDPWKNNQTITFGDNANFSGALGIAIGSNNTVVTGRTVA
ncbi:hypothetical protein M378DRAFT_111327 [Amanita muscaria Koide BX008]|uniref:Fungal N-terminal domain-containing protein n=1 Tax=Amanita muscaria (strain Koide BX008) TaxID=946122 RepID=A0A0C2WCR9_AMAMK|nr:hypothetical protein M378DRAFT_111327 [Amanita muscaria Koide BX008]